MSDLSDLYQEIIIDHCKRPRNFGALGPPARVAEGYNPLCGDQVKVYVSLDGDRVASVRFEGSGCAISTASASLMTEALKGRTEQEAQALFEGFLALLTTGHGADSAVPLGKLEVLSGVHEFPVRVKCATLAWHTLHAALHDETRPVSTE